MLIVIYNPKALIVSWQLRRSSYAPVRCCPKGYGVPPFRSLLTVEFLIGAIAGPCIDKGVKSLAPAYYCSADKSHESSVSL